MGALEIIAPPARPVLTVGDLRAHLRIDGRDDDDLLVAYEAAASSWAAEFCRRAWITTTLRETFDADEAFLVRAGGSGSKLSPSTAEAPIELGRAPVQSVTSVTYLDDDGDTVTVSASDYRLLPGVRARVAPAVNGTWPTPADVEGAVAITYVAGYGDDGADVPATVRAAVRLLVGHLYENREAVVIGTIATEVPMTVRDLLAPYRVPRVTR